MKERLCCCLLFDKVVHLHSLNKFSNDTDLVNPVTRRAASFWIFVKFVSPVQSIHVSKGAKIRNRYN